MHFVESPYSETDACAEPLVMFRHAATKDLSAPDTVTNFASLRTRAVFP